MKKIGLVGGTSWTSTIDYYRIINEEVNKRYGHVHSAECIVYSVDFQHFCDYNAAHDWEAVFVLLSHAALQLEKAGADMLLLGANTAHIVADRVREAIDLPLVDIRTETAKAIRQKKIKKAGLLGTVYTMELSFYKDRLLEYGVETIIPCKADRDYLENTLSLELGRGIIKQQTKREYLRIANDLVEQGAEGIVLGCTEIPLIINEADLLVPVFNTTRIHAEAAVNMASQF